jgi:hypothetical protein
MNRANRLLERLDQIAAVLQADPAALALIGLGSVGLELERLDAFSDLDFFVVVEPERKTAYLAELTWLAAAHPLAYSFQNTVDGYKALFADGIFCEFAVFEPEELTNIPFAAGRVVWKRETVPTEISIPQQALPRPTVQSEAWLLGEALTNLYIGLRRYRRGEKLSARRFIQGYAFERVLELIELSLPAVTAERDPFSLERRWEQRFPQLKEWLVRFLPGYEHSPLAAQAILEFLQAHFEAPEGIAGPIRAEIEAALNGRIQNGKLIE